MRFNAAVVAHGVRGTNENALFVSTNGAREVEAIISELWKQLPNTALIIVAIGWGIKAVLDRLAQMSRRMDCFESTQHACQLDNAKYFATKAELYEVETDVAEHERRISRLEGSK